VTPATQHSERVAALRRDLGPVAWCALECLVERADSNRVVEASTRSLARDLGVAKNTAHRALRTLVNAGLVATEQERSTDGRFRAGRYRLHVDQLIARATAPVSPARRRRTRPSAAHDDQLDLLPRD
jgi:DNA-binding IclR family transcriptional regulator